MRRFGQKIKIWFLTVILIAAIFGSCLFPVPAKAQVVTVSSYPMADGFFIDYQRTKALQELDRNQNFIVMNAVINAMQYFANKIAYDTAVWMASGNWGQSPFTSTQSFGDYIAGVAGDSLGEALGSLGESWGLNLCDLPDLRLDLALKIGFHFAYEPPKPKCSWQQLKQNFSAENIKSKYGTQEALLNRIGANIEVQDTDFGVWFSAKERIDSHAAEQSAAAAEERKEGSGAFSMTDLITGNVRTPNYVMKEEILSQSYSKKQNTYQEANSAQVWGAFGTGATQVAYQAASVFINTMLGTMLKNFMENGMLPGGTKVCNPGLRISGVNLDDCAREDSGQLASNYYADGGGSDYRRAAQEMFSELLTPKIRTLENYNLAAKMADCSPDNLAPDACVIDQSFLQVLQSAENGEPLSVKQAIEKGWLHGDWKLVSNTNLQQTDKRDCAIEAYCQRNLSFLRQARVLSIGWEMAASISAPGQEPTLNQVVKNFYNESSPYYNLINPYWVIKLPTLRCKSYVYGPVAQDGTRVEECADLQHCVGYNKDGTCQAWGYCLKEQPIWKFSGDYCDAQFATCRAFTDSSGETTGYLTRTLDAKYCNADNVGCLSYSKGRMRIANFWVWWLPTVWYDENSGTFTNSTVNLNAKAETCDAADDGCSAFRLASDPETLIYLKKAPDYAACYDADFNAEFNAYILEITGAVTLEMLETYLPAYCSKYPNACAAGMNAYNKMKTYCQNHPKICKLSATAYAFAEKQALQYFYYLVRRGDGIQWPQTVGDLSRIEMPADNVCAAKYARVCLPEEENCDLFTSLMDGEEIPGKFKPAEVKTGSQGDYLVWNDQCSEKCVGYDAYREMPASYSDGSPLAYIVPSSGKTCQPSESGCTAFTDMTAVQGGLQKAEYFSYLRLCILPDQNKQKNFYIYEASEAGGYKLRGFVLQKDTSGAPLQIFRDQDERARLTAAGVCDLAAYKAGAADPDCHQFNDDAGNTYYKLLSKTVLVAENCAPYRLNQTELVAGPNNTNICPFDLNSSGGSSDGAVENREGACYYFGLPPGDTRGAGETAACSAEVDSCRPYKGNAGDNTRLIYTESFEGQLAAGWGGGANLQTAAESTQLGGHSLKMIFPAGGAQNGVHYGDLSVSPGKSYILTFWAKGNTWFSEVALRDQTGAAVFATNLALTDVWRRFSFGPIEYSGTATTTLLNLISNAAGSVYLDNVRLSEVTDYLYLVKNSLNVDPVCDSNQNDNLPGEALGCRAYKNRANSTFYLTGFSYLCRSEAVGCTALLDTYNKPDDPLPRAYNVWLWNYDWEKYFTGGEISVKIGTGEGEQEFSCMMSKGEAGCYVNIFGKEMSDITASLQNQYNVFIAAVRSVPDSSPFYAAAAFASSTAALYGDTADLTSLVATVYLPAQTPSSSPIYLVADEAATCRSQNMGCQVLGKTTLTPSLPVWTPKYEAVAIKNDPALFDDTLCPLTAVGCQAFASGNSEYYFKDPKVNGLGTCEYRDEITGGIKLKGWFHKDVKVCWYEVGNTGVSLPNDFLPCQSDAGCLPIGGKVGKCMPTPCYPFYRKWSGEYGLWSYGNWPLYLGFTGECPIEQSGCSEFIDRSGEESRKCILSGKKCEKDADCNEIDNDKCGEEASKSAYYLIENEKLTQAQNKCNGQVSRAEGCVLLDKTALPNKYWDAPSSYNKSWTNDDKLVTPVSLPLKNDSNTIMKVTHDRECAEWAYCNFYQTTPDQDTGEMSSRCYALGVCQEANLSVGNQQQCSQIVSDRPEAGKVLNADFYQERGTTWDTLEYSGYSVPYRYQVPDLKVRAYLEGGEPRLYYVVQSGICEPRSVKNKSTCATDSNGNTIARCWEGECLYNYSGAAGDPSQSRTLSCRGYAELDSPYPSGVVKEIEEGYVVYKDSFEDVNLCRDPLEPGKPVDDCEIDGCSYNRVKTAAGDVFLKSGSGVDNFICVGGANEGVSCCPSELNCVSGAEDTATCGVGGACSVVKGLNVTPGWPGYCLEYDNRQRINGDRTGYRCLTWWPVEEAPGASTFWNTDLEAGYQVGQVGEEAICLENAPVLANDYSSGAPEISLQCTDDSGGGNALNDDQLFQFSNSFMPEGVQVSRTGYGLRFTDFPPNAVFLNASGRHFNKDFATHRQNITSQEEVCGINMDDSTNNYAFGYYTRLDRGTDFGPDGNLPGSGAIYKNEIERIDVVFDDDDSYSGQMKGYVSFINTFDGKFSPGYKFPTPTLADGEIKLSVKTKSGDLGSGHYYWQISNFSPADPSPDPFLNPSNENGDLGTVKGCIVNGSERCTASNDKSDVDIHGLGVRVVFEDSGTANDILRGVWIVHHIRAVEPRIEHGWFYVIRFTDGRCKKIALVSAPDGVDQDKDVGFFKPFTGRLKTNTGLPKPAVEPDRVTGNRKAEFDGGGGEDANYSYGLLSETNAAFISPFIPWSGVRGDGNLLNHASTFGGGVPLVAWRSESDKSLYTYSDYSKVTKDGRPFDDMLSMMFAKVYGYYKLGEGTGYDSESGSIDAANPDTAEDLGLNIYPPMVAAPVTLNGKNSMELNAISVNDHVAGQIYTQPGQAFIRFYVWAHPNQMPLRKIILDKTGQDTGPTEIESASFANKKLSCAGGWCKNSSRWDITCDPSQGASSNPVCRQLGNYDCVGIDDDEAFAKFGSTLGTGCSEGYVEFFLDLTCPNAEAETRSWSQLSPADKAGVLATTGGTPVSSVCVYKPHVQAMDNWGWCTGSCDYGFSNDVIKGEGCYSDYAGGNDCGLAKTAPWIQYDGEIIVAPGSQ